jgi:hypothetical protein
MEKMIRFQLALLYKLQCQNPLQHPFQHLYLPPVTVDAPRRSIVRFQGNAWSADDNDFILENMETGDYIWDELGF